MFALLRRNLAWIVLSLLLSTALWIAVTFQVNPEVTNTIGSIPLEIQDAPKSVVVQASTSTVQVQVSAPSDVWPELKLEKFRAFVDASRVGPGVQELSVKVVTTDPRARVEVSDPDKITVRVDPLRTKVVPVQVNQQGAVPFGYESGTAKTTPTEVTVSGPQSSVDQVTVAIIDVSLDGQVKTIDQSYRPIPETTSGARVDRVTLAPEAVLVQVAVEQKLLYKTLPVQPKLQGNVALGYQVVGMLVDPQTVTLVGDPKTLNDLQFVPTRPVNVDSLTSDREFSIDYDLPATVALYRFQTSVVRVLVTASEGSKTIIVSPSLTNTTASLNYTVVPGSVNVTLDGPVPILSRLGPGDTPVTVDVRGVMTGTQALRADVKVPPLVRLHGVDPTMVTVTAK